MPDRMILSDEGARLVLTTGDGTVLYDAALSYAAVAHSLDRGHGYEPEVIRFAYSAPTGAPEECEGHTDDDAALTSGKGIGEAVYCDGSCLPPAYVVRHARLIIEPLDGPDEEPPPRPQIYTDAAGVRHFRPSH